MKRRALRLLATATLLAAPLVLAGMLSADSGPAHQAPQARPIALGSSGGNIHDASSRACCAGTLGALVTDGATQYVLSNNHVLARSNSGTGGDPIIQPGLIDQAPVCSPDAADVVANLTDWEPIRFLSFRNRQATNTVDAAIAAVAPGKVQSDGSILDIGPISSIPDTAQIGMSVQKSGRTTGHTAGTVAAVNATIIVRYGGPCGGGRGRARFANQVRITPGDFSAGGDSGSLIVDDSTPPRAVGLLFAGSASDTFANPIQSALDVLGVSLVGSASTGQAPFSRWLGSLLGWASTAHAAPRGRLVDPVSLAAARHARQRHEDAIMRLAGVLGLGVGMSDLVPGDAAVEVYVERDTPARRRAIPAWLDGVGVRVVETGEIVARAAACSAR